MRVFRGSTGTFKVAHCKYTAQLVKRTESRSILVLETSCTRHAPSQVFARSVVGVAPDSLGYDCARMSIVKLSVRHKEHLAAIIRCRCLIAIL